MTNATMTDAEFEAWWEGLSEWERSLEVRSYLNVPDVEPWSVAGYLLDYARTHEPPLGREDIPPRVWLEGIKPDHMLHAYVVELWQTTAGGPTGPAAVQKAFVKAHKVRR